MDPLTEIVTLGSALFYLAEVGQNPQVTHFYDAFHYVSTSLSVGYANIFPVTPVGRLIGGIVMMVGPALSAKALDGKLGKGEDGAEMMGEKLDAILVELRKLNARLEAPQNDSP